MTARHRVSKLLLRQGIVYYGGRAWTKVHDTWLRAQHFDAPGLQLTYETAYDTMLAAVDRRDRLDAAIAAMATDSDDTLVMTRLGCLRGVSTLTALGLAVEIGDWQRLTGRSTAAAPLGPCQSCGPGSRTASKPASAGPLGWLRRPRQTPALANAAIARELAGCCWSLAVLDT